MTTRAACHEDSCTEEFYDSYERLTSGGEVCTNHPIRELQCCQLVIGPNESTLQKTPRSQVYLVDKSERGHLHQQNLSTMPPPVRFWAADRYQVLLLYDRGRNALQDHYSTEPLAKAKASFWFHGEEALSLRKIYLFFIRHMQADYPTSCRPVVGRQRPVHTHKFRSIWKITQNACADP